MLNFTLFVADNKFFYNVSKFKLSLNKIIDEIRIYSFPIMLPLKQINVILPLLNSSLCNISDWSMEANSEDAIYLWVGEESYYAVFLTWRSSSLTSRYLRRIKTGE